MLYQKKPTERQLKIYGLRKKAQLDEAAMQLFLDIKLECGIILNNPNGATENMVRRYNELVRASGLPLPEREELLMPEKK